MIGPTSPRSSCPDERLAKDTPGTQAPAPAAAHRADRRAQRGQVLILVAVMTTVLLGMVAIVTDTAMVWINRRYLQNAVDAAALAGAQQLPDDLSGAEAFACAYATTDNHVDGMFGKTGDCSLEADVTFDTTYVDNDTITVTAYKQVVPFMAGLFGWDGMEVSADASALVGSISSSCPFPIFQTPEMLPGGAAASLEFYTLTALHLSGSDNQKGNFLTVDVGSGANAVLDAMVNAGCSVPIGPEASTEPGGKIGKVIDGFAWRIFCAGGGGTKPNNTPACPDKPKLCPSADISTVIEPGRWELKSGVTRETCTRLVVLPIFPGTLNDYTGKTTVDVVGFAVFYIAGYCNQATCTHPTLGAMKKGDAWGYYVHLTGTAEYYTVYNNLGTKVVVLID